MTAADLYYSESDGNQHVVTGIAEKIQRGREDTCEADFVQLRDVVRQHPEAIPYLDRALLQGTTSTPPPLAGQATIVRYRGMVQDMLETEYYLSEVQGVKTHYRDYHAPSTQDPLDAVSVAGRLAERQPLVVVPVPFASKWFLGNKKNAHGGGAVQVGGPKHKNKREHEAIEFTIADTTMSPLTSKRNIPNTTMEEIDTPLHGNIPSSLMDKPCISNLDWWPPGCMGSHVDQCPVLAKVYYDRLPSNDRRLRLNDVVEFIGVLTMDPMEADFSQQQQNRGLLENEWDEFDGHAEELFDRTVVPPPSLLPRIHVLYYNTLDIDEILVDRTCEQDSADEMDIDSTGHDKSDDRCFAIQFLSKYLLGGNDNAAEAMLMVLMSMAEREKISDDTWTPAKTPSNAALGCASLNFILPDQEVCTSMHRRVERILQQIVPVVGSIHLSRGSLGNTVVSPAKSDSGRLKESHLQLPRSAALVINQGPLTEGPITARGQETMCALASLCCGHSVPYCFDGMMRYEFEADYRVIVLSIATPGRQCNSGSKLLPCAMQMNISRIQSKELDREDLPLSECKRVRSYLARCRSRSNTANGQRDCDGSRNIPMSREILELAQKDFIQRRVEHRENQNKILIGQTLKPLEAELGEDALHRWLTISRLQARSTIGMRSDLSTAATIENWKDALRLDDAMREFQ